MGADLRRAAVVVGLVAAVVYANALGNGFAYDDFPIVVANPGIQSIGSLPQAVMSPYWPGASGPTMALWRPMTTAVLGLQHVLGAGSPVIFHATNVLLHAVTSAVLVVLLGHLVAGPTPWIAGLIFAVHPVHAEAVANVVGVAELLSALAVLMACLVHLRGGERSTWRTSLALGCLYAVGFGAKEGAVMLPALLLLIDAAKQRLSLRDIPAYTARRWRAYLVMAVVASTLLVLRFSILGSVAGTAAPLGADLLREIPRIWTLGEIWIHYVRLSVFPLDLSADYSPNVIPISFGWHATNIVGVGLVLATLVGSLAAWRRGPLGKTSQSARVAAFGVVWFGIAVLPVSNTLFLSGVLLAERTLYLPSVGLAVAAGWLLARLGRDRRGLASTLVVIVVLVAAARTWTRTPVWRSNQAVFASMLGDYPHSGRSQWLLGDSFLASGLESEALLAYRAAVNLLDRHYMLLTHVTARLIEMERYEGAEGLLRITIHDYPTLPIAYAQLAGIRAEQGDAVGAERYSRAFLELYPGDPVQRHVLAWALATQGAWEEAANERVRANQSGRVDFWHRWLYDAYVLQRASDEQGMRSALDSANAKVGTEVGRSALDYILRERFPPR